MQNRWTARRVIGIMGAAQIDRYGNLNSTVIGDYNAPRVRFSGSGGACDVASFVSRSIIFMQHAKRKFVPRVDYRTSPGWLQGSGSRKAAGLTGEGPSLVVTDLATMGFDEPSKEMYLQGYYPGVTPAQILDKMGFEVDTSRARPIPPPTPQELHILRIICDPQRLILG
jgi:glutaconate CoA-transferase subunit B